jgi:hypothetical protein
MLFWTVKPVSIVYISSVHLPPWPCIQGATVEEDPSKLNRHGV